MSQPHTSVMPTEILEFLARPAAYLLLDGTLGAGGHSALLLEALPDALLLGLDRDPSALTLARERLAPFGDRARLVRAPFADAVEVAAAEGLGPFDAILLDVGISSMQVDEAERGFSFQVEGPLDMRMDPDGETTAADLVNELDAESLANIIYELGEERRSRRIARAIVEARKHSPITTTTQLAEIVWRANPSRRPPKGVRRRRRPIHPATRTFQALRLAVNDELGQLDRALPALWGLLAPGGRLCVISFHSLEDRRVKLFFREQKRAGLAKVLTKKPLRPSDDEVERNPRARSAKLRVAERLAETISA